MKTTIKLGMLTAAFLLAFASCSNIVKDPVAATDDVAKSVVTEHATAGKGFTVTEIKGNYYGDIAATTNAHYQVKITFSYRPDEDSVKEGVTFKTLKNKIPADSYSMPDVKDTFKADAVQFVGNEVYFTFNKTLGDIKHLYVFVDAAKVKAVNGAQLNHDGDDKQGEVGDDSYAMLLNTDASLVGNKNYEQELSGENDTWNNNKTNKTWALTAEIGVDPTVSGEEKYMLKRVKLSLADLPYSVDYKAEDYDAMANSLTGHINNHVKIEEYDWKEGKWNPVTASFSYVSADKAWYASVSIPAGHYARAKFIDRDKAEKYTGKKLRGYDIKYTLANEIKGASPEHEIRHSEKYSKPSFPKEFAYFWTKDDVDVETTKPGRVSIEFKDATKVKTFDPANNEGAYVTNGWHKVSFKNKLPGADKKTLFRGFEEPTVTAKKEDGVYTNFKCFNKTDGALLAIKDIKVIKSKVKDFPEALNKIIILFEDSKAEAKDVYISPDVKTQSFTGSDLDASPVADFLFPSMSFANPKPYTETSSPDKNALYGWNKLTN